MAGVRHTRVNFPVKILNNIFNPQNTKLHSCFGRGASESSLVCFMTISKSVCILRDYTIVIFNFFTINPYNAFIDLPWFFIFKIRTYIIKIINILISCWLFGSGTFTYCFRHHFYSYGNVEGAKADGVCRRKVHVALCCNKFNRYYTTGSACAFDDTKFYEWLAGLIDGDGYIYERQNGLFSIVITFDIRDILLAPRKREKGFNKN